MGEGEVVECGGAGQGRRGSRVRAGHGGSGKGEGRMSEKVLAAPAFMPY